MTHSEIDTLVRDWPDAARKGYQYYDTVTPDQTVPDADTLYWAMVGRGLAWLAENDYAPLLHGVGVHWVVAGKHTTREDNELVKPHPLAAVSAAVLAAKEGER